MLLWASKAMSASRTTPGLHAQAHHQHHPVVFEGAYADHANCCQHGEQYVFVLRDKAKDVSLPRTNDSTPNPTPNPYFSIWCVATSSWPRCREDEGTPERVERVCQRKMGVDAKAEHEQPRPCPCACTDAAAIAVLHVTGLHLQLLPDAQPELYSLATYSTSILHFYVKLTNKQTNTRRVGTGTGGGGIVRDGQASVGGGVLKLSAVGTNVLSF